MLSSEPMVRPIVAPTPKRRDEGLHRTRHPSETESLIQPHLRSLGITRVANVTGMDDIGIPTVMVIRPNSRSLSVSQGKGATLEAARVSGLMESIEQHCAESAIRPLFLASHEELARSRDVVDVTRLPRFVRAYRASERILWTEANDLGRGTAFLVPYELVHLDLRLPLTHGSGFFLGGSNGLASGNHPLEAVIHGLCELIERDALTLFYGLPAEVQAERRVALSSVNDPLCSELLARYERAAVDVAIWDMTSDIDVACFFCSVMDRSTNPFRPLGVARGYGCHPVRGVALARALTEAAQSRLTRIVGSRDDLRSAEVAALRAQEALERNRSYFDPRLPTPRTFEASPTFDAPTLDQDLEHLQAKLAGAGLRQILTVDLSSPELPVYVVRVIVPGLEALCELPGYQPGERARRTTACT